jgi:hypothetical protein
MADTDMEGGGAQGEGGADLGDDEGDGTEA